MNKILQGLSYKVYSTSLRKFKTSESSVLIIGKSAILSQRLVTMLTSNIGLYLISGKASQ